MATNIKIIISIDKKILNRIDSMVEKKMFANRSKAIQTAVEEKIYKHNKTRLAIESAKLSKNEEQQLANEGLKADLREWPEY